MQAPSILGYEDSFLVPLWIDCPLYYSWLHVVDDRGLLARKLDLDGARFDSEFPYPSTELPLEMREEMESCGHAATLRLLSWSFLVVGGGTVLDAINYIVR